MLPRRLLRLTVRATLLCTTCLAWGLLPCGVAAQTTAAALRHSENLRTDAGAVTEQQRAELYRILQRNAEVLEAQATVVKTVAKLIGPTVVHIEADVESRIRPYRQLEENGSGVIVRLGEKYYVLTNRHVIHNASAQGIKINLADGRRIQPAKIWTHADTDVGVMLVSAPNLVAAPIGDSDRMEIGDFVLAVGSPFDLRHSVTFGIVSAKGRRDLRLDEAQVALQDFLQTDAAINPGNSGGPLVNLRGEIIGINTAIASNSGIFEGIGFSIPINMFMFFGRQLIEHGRVTRAFLGVNLDADFGPAKAAKLGLPRPVGARVTGVTRGAPAEAAELQVGDVILRFDGTAVQDDDHLVNLVSLTEVGKMVPLVIFRQGETLSVVAEVGARDKFKPSR